MILSIYIRILFLAICTIFPCHQVSRGQRMTLPKAAILMLWAQYISSHQYINLQQRSVKSRMLCIVTTERCFVPHVATPLENYKQSQDTDRLDVWFKLVTPRVYQLNEGARPAVALVQDSEFVSRSRGVIHNRRSCHRRHPWFPYGGQSNQHCTLAR